MPYKVLTGMANDIGANTEGAFRAAMDALEKSVDEHEKDGWQLVGGHQVALRNRPQGHLVVASQAVIKHLPEDPCDAESGPTEPPKPSITSKPKGTK